MRHQVKAKHLNRDSNSRKALFKGLVTSLITSGVVHTTEPKAKVIKGLVDKLIHKAQEGSVNTRRILARFFGRRDVVNQLVDKVAPAMNDRSSGFTRIVRIGKRRGDNTMMVKMELVKNPHIDAPTPQRSGSSDLPETVRDDKADVKTVSALSKKSVKETKTESKPKKVAKK